ncbi:hypothetical protein SK128_012899 [Halocaridina rubra]|uniref:Uncharacterized protein n=1 Tax=Halocaridina rubra TaxID=373956 RepID=A0AAN8WLN0_HALRR
MKARTVKELKQHQAWTPLVCFKILDEEEAPGKHNCEICNTPTSPCTDPCLLDVDDIAFTCLYRRILVFFQDFDGRVTPSLVSQRLGVDISIGKKIIMRLNSDRLLTKKGLKWGKIVNKSQLVKNAIPLYLSKPLKMACSNSPSKEKMETATLETALTPMRKIILSDSDATPDMLAPQPQCSMSGLNDEDDIIDIMEMSQDADVGTQIPKSAVQQVKGSVCREPTHLNNMEYCASQSQALATVGNSVEVLTPQKNEDSIMEDKASEFVMMDSENVENVELACLLVTLLEASTLFIYFYVGIC